MKTVRRPPYPKWNPGYFPCSSLTPLPLSSRRPSVSFGGFGLRRRTPDPEKLCISSFGFANDSVANNVVGMLCWALQTYRSQGGSPFDHPT